MSCDFTRDQIECLKRTLKDSVGLAALAAKVERAELDRALTPARNLIMERRELFGKDMVCFVYHLGETRRRETKKTDIEQEIVGGARIIYLNDSGSVVRTAKSGKVLEDPVTYSVEKKAICFTTYGITITWFAGGHEFIEAVVRSGKREQEKWNRSWKDLESVLSDHFTARVKNEKGLEYWKDRNKRIFISQPSRGTEILFHRDLFWWCDNFIHDAVNVYAEPSGLGQDKTDINICTTDGVLVLEVKWLGKNERKTEYKEDRIDSGLIQVASYLDNNERFIIGYLVIYDGRCEADHQSASGWSKDICHQRCKNPIIFFLPSETPSQEGERKAKEMRNKQVLAKGN